MLNSTYNTEMYVGTSPDTDTRTHFKEIICGQSCCSGSSNEEIDYRQPNMCYTTPTEMCMPYVMLMCVLHSSCSAQRIRQPD